MAKGLKTQPLMPSILDRLIQPNARQTIVEIKEGIRRDLEDLLNTRWRPSSWPPNLDELNISLVNYGIPDFTGANLGSPESQEEFRKIIQSVIKNYEPRLQKVQVELVRSKDLLDRTLRFRIDAELRTEPVPEQVVFDSALEPLNSSFTVSEGRR